MDLKKLIIAGIGAIVLMILLIIYVWHKKSSEENLAQPAEPMSKAEAYKKVFN
ncbi:MAG: hypothetical protein PHX13_06205 [Thiovulaceae bacterium]|nr:hypothetical protein [Sulfurimonadaceae bacterium]